MDIVDAYLESILRLNKQPIFIKIPQSRQLKQNNLVYKIFKCLYGLKQAERPLNKIIIKFFQKLDFDTTNEDFCIFILIYKKDLIIIKIYIDNLLFRFKSHITLEWLKNQLIKEFQ